MRTGAGHEHHLRQRQLRTRGTTAAFRLAMAGIVSGVAIFSVIAFSGQVAGAATDVVLNCNNSGSRIRRVTKLATRLDKKA